MRRTASKEANATRVQDILSQKNENPTWLEPNTPTEAERETGGEKDEGGREGEREVEWEERVEKKGGREAAGILTAQGRRRKAENKEQGMSDDWG